MTPGAAWERFKAHLVDCPDVGIRLDLSRLRLPQGFLEAKDAAIRQALTAMAELEAGAIANPDERRMVGHYWLRAPSLAPSSGIARAISATRARITRFARAVHAGRVRPPRARAFSNLLLIGIGGSALGPQFVARALGSPARDRLRPYFIDNTDPDGIDHVLATIGDGLSQTLAIVVSKSGSTPETRNGMLEAQRAWKAAGLAFGPQAVAVTQAGSALERAAIEGGWLERFPMWDWVGGRTSALSAVGLLPAALQGIDVEAMLRGARDMDALTRASPWRGNPAAVMALAWYHAAGGRGAKDMVILPYKDRLELLGRYLQQLVMESLGKERDVAGRVVNQGLAVYGNKGSTDQHAYVQQLREGPDDFFVTFVEVLRDRRGRSMEVEPRVTSGDYLQGFLLGTREALWENGRESVTLTVPDVSPRTVGMLIALYERAVGLYASLVGINAYHQPGVEAGKQAAADVLELQRAVVAHLAAVAPRALTADELAAESGAAGREETIFKVLEHLAANPDRGIRRTLPPGGSAFEARYAATAASGVRSRPPARPITALSPPRAPRRGPGGRA
jgi:glucose-6-phosphate isomerase